MKKYFIILAVALSFSSCMEEEPLKLDFHGFSPKQMNDGWQISTPAEENIDESLLKNAYGLFYSENDFPMAKSLLVIRNEKLVAEAYCKDENDINRIENLQSMTKSITSLLTGIAIKKGLIDSINTPLYNYYPEYFDQDLRKRKITILDAITMTAGLEFDNDVHTEEMYHTKESSLKYVLSHPVIFDAGNEFLYNDGLPQLVGGVINKVSGQSLEQFATENLFSPLGITDHMWEKANDGLNFGAFSLYLKPRDLAKLGQLCLQNGKWNNIQLIDDSWILEASSISYCNIAPNWDYGFYFWIYHTHDGYEMNGHGGQFVYICPEKNLVTVYTAFPYTSNDLEGNPERLINAVYNACE